MELRQANFEILQSFKSETVVTYSVDTDLLAGNADWLFLQENIPEQRTSGPQICCRYLKQFH